MTAFVYIVCNSHGHRKIGLTSNLDGRMQSLQNGNSRPIKLEAVAECEKPREVEQAMHAIFRRFRMSGEWFDISFEDALAGLQSGVA